MHHAVPGILGLNLATQGITLVSPAVVKIEAGKEHRITQFVRIIRTKAFHLVISPFHLLGAGVEADTFLIKALTAAFESFQTRQGAQRVVIVLLLVLQTIKEPEIVDRVFLPVYHGAQHGDGRVKFGLLKIAIDQLTAVGRILGSHSYGVLQQPYDFGRVGHVRHKAAYGLRAVRVEVKSSAEQLATGRLIPVQALTYGFEVERIVFLLGFRRKRRHVGRLDRKHRNTRHSLCRATA